MADHAAPQPIWYPNQRVLRTLATRIVAGAPVGVSIIGITAAQWPVGWLVAASATAASIQLVLTKIIALPAVDAWLSANTPIGSTPQSAITT